MSSATPRSAVFDKWWPTTQSLDLVFGDVEQVATAVAAEISRFLRGVAIESAWVRYTSVDEAFTAAGAFENVPTFFLVLPSRTPWTVLWNNSFLCNGYDSLCYCLTLYHGLRTLHWAAHDETTSFQPGAQFRHRTAAANKVVDRSVYVGREDRKWIFHESGDPMPEEVTANYTAKRKSDRLNEDLMMQFLARLGASPWIEESYALREQACFTMRRLDSPAAGIRRDVVDVVTGRLTSR